MPSVTFLPAGKTVEVPPGTDLLTAAATAAVEIDAPCGAKGSCGRCAVRVVDGSMEAAGDRLSPTAAAAGYVQACRSHLTDEAVTIEIPPRLAVQGQFAESSLEAVDPQLLPGTWQLNPLIERWVLRVEPAITDEVRSDFDRLQSALQHEIGHYRLQCPLPVLQILADAVREQEGWVTVTGTRRADRFHILELAAGKTQAPLCGLAADIGTTTVAAQLVSLADGKILAEGSDYNQQIACGLDIISRINYARRPERLTELQSRGLTTINRLIANLSRKAGIDAGRIQQAMISGNTTMIHLLLGLKPEYIRLAPYTPTLLEFPPQTAEAVGLDIHPRSPVLISPGVGSYVGGDITAGLLCTDMAVEKESISLFIDIGTNGELAVGNQDFIVGCACSAGPAFEGGGIACGMRAAAGAIEKIEIDPKTGLACLQTIGDIEPSGICGSGMISLLAELLKKGWMDSAGKLNREGTSPAIEIQGRQARYRLARLKTGDELSISEVEIESVIRAKAAIYAAVSLMLEQAGLAFGDLARIYIAGGFGRFLNLEDAVTIGMLPDLSRDIFHYLGNASLAGTWMTLVSREHHQRQRSLGRRITYIDLSSDPGYMDQYTAALFLPHTDRSAFPSVFLP